MKKLPYPNIKTNAYVDLNVSKGLTVNGSEGFETWSGDVVFTEHHAWVQTGEGKKVKGKGKIFIFHDICPSISQLSGKARIRGVTYNFEGSRLFNPDGSVHHVELGLI